VSQNFAEARYELAVANRILGHEGVLDAFGHVSMRHPADPGKYLLPRSRSPELIEPDDIFEFTLDSAPIVPPKVQLYSERVIHGEIYKARPDVMAVCHHHAPAVMPFCITGEPLVPVFHLGATIGAKVPFWDSQDEFGDTNLLVVKPEEGASLARALGSHSVVLMRRHGATVVGAGLRELVFRSIFSCLNAIYLKDASRMGPIGPLTPGEIEMAGAINQIPSVPLRTWEYWATRLAKRGGMPPRGRTSAAAGKRSSLRAGRRSAGGKRGKVKGRNRR